MWSQKYKYCQNCGTTDRKHIARGLCDLCYQKSIEKKHLPEKRLRGFASNLLTEEYLREHYLIKQESLSDISSNAKCSRQYVLKKVNEYGIPLRKKSKARELALDSNKIKFERQIGNGNSEIITLSKNLINHNFFSKWSPQMAYVLGIVCTDGNIRPSILKNPNTKDSIRVSRLTISQKETELLKKVLKLMNCDTKLLYRKRKKFLNTVSGETYYFHLNSDRLYDDLIRLGLTPNKSLTLKFPNVPKEYVNHFIRGCWDGDGSVFIDKTSNSIFASFVSGSYEFISAILNNLIIYGLPPRKLHSRGNSYYFRYTGNQCKQLAQYLYTDADNAMWLNRKYKLFMKAL